MQSKDVQEVFPLSEVVGVEVEPVAEVVVVVEVEVNAVVVPAVSAVAPA